MNDYPDFYPPFMRDFHDMKDVSKAFFHWLDLMDNRQKVVYGREVETRRSNMSNWMDFSVLMVSFLDFLFIFGYQVQRTRRAGEYWPVEVIDDLAHFFELYLSVVHPDEPLAYKPEVTAERMEKWGAFLRFMPDEVQEAWAKTLEAKKATQESE